MESPVGTGSTNWVENTMVGGAPVYKFRPTCGAVGFEAAFHTKTYTS